MSLTLNLTLEQALAIAWMQEAASKDDMRPVIEAIQLEWSVKKEVVTLEVIATDSYMMAVRKFTFEQHETTPKQVEGTALISGKALAKVLKDAVALAKSTTKAREVPDEREVVLTLESGSSMASISASNGMGAEWTLDYVEGKYPNWRQLVPKQMHFNIPEDSGMVEWPALNPFLLARACKIHRQPMGVLERVGGRQPFQLGLSSLDNAAHKPIILQEVTSTVSKSDYGELTILVMPVRTT